MADIDLDRFRGPVREHLDDVVEELTAGRKRTHWMWFTFPQLRSLGRSEMARRYGLEDLDEARRFVTHPELGPTYARLVAIVHEVVVRQGLLVHDVFGSPDDVKLVSSLTLFQAAAVLEERTELAERCRDLLDVAERQGLSRCLATIAAIEAATGAPVYAATERSGLGEFLDMQRDALIGKLHGLTEHEARQTPTVSALSLLSLVKHSAIWERRWFQVVAAGRRFPGEWPEVHTDDENAFRLDDDDTIESVVEYYREQIGAAREILRTADLDAPCAMPETASNVRWVALHMIEETARHAGHADILRETIDKRTA